MKSIPKEHLKSICKIGQKGDCCRYIVVDPEIGFACAKLDLLSVAINKNLPNMVAKSDNCEGLK
jgi:hypothetical protein